MPKLKEQPTTPETHHAAHPDSNYMLNLGLCLGVLTVAYLLMINPDLLDRPLIRFMNGFSGKIYAIDLALYDIYAHNLLSGVVFISLIWGAWFESDDLIHRSRILLGTLASSGAGVISRFLQHTLHTHPRPYYDQVIAFKWPLDIRQPDLNTWNSFPSDTATVYTGLVTVLWLSGSRFRVAASVWLLIVLITRAYNGAHYPTDLIAGAGLGSLFVWCSQAPWLVDRARLVAKFERRSPAIFYMLAFLATYEIATLFNEVRSIVGGFSVLKRIF